MRALIEKVQTGISVTLICLLIIVIFQNMEPAETDILFFTIELPRAMLLGFVALVSFLVGVIVGVTKL